MGSPGFKSQYEQEIFLFSKTSKLIVRFTSQGEKQLGHKVHHSPPSSAEDKNEWSYTSTPPVCLPGMDRDSFTFT